MNCPCCGQDNPLDARYCLRCGTPLVPGATAYSPPYYQNYPTYQLPHKEGWIAAVLSFIIAGVG